VDRNGSPVVNIAGLGDFDAWVDGSLSSSTSAGGSLRGLAQLCRRWELDSVLDGVPESEFKTCLQAGSAQCDLCLSRAATPAAAAAAAAPAAASSRAAAVTAFVRRGNVAPGVRPLGALSVGGGGGRAVRGHLRQQQQQVRSRPGGPGPSSVGGSSSGFVSQEMPGGHLRASWRLFGAGEDATTGDRAVEGAAAAAAATAAVSGAGAGSGVSPPARTRPSAADGAIGNQRRSSNEGWVLGRGFVGSSGSSPALAAGIPVAPANAAAAARLDGLGLPSVAAGSDEDGRSASERGAAAAAAAAALPATAAGGGCCGEGAAEGGGRGSVAGGAAASAASQLPAATLVPDERTLVFTQHMMDVMRSGGLAAGAPRQRHADDVPLPCARCCARGLQQQPSGDPSTATCFLGTCCSCLKQTNGWCGGADLKAVSAHTERCNDGWVDCKSRRQAWDTGVQGQRCLGCTLHIFYKPQQTASAVSSHAVLRYGPKACSWLFCIRVTLTQVQLARRRMSQRRPGFGPGLQDACGVAWRTRSARDGVAGPVPPTLLLDWGPMQAPASADRVAEWLTSST